jgi:hypothetical protein
VTRLIAFKKSEIEGNLARDFGLFYPIRAFKEWFLDVVLAFADKVDHASCIDFCKTLLRAFL